MKSVFYFLAIMCFSTHMLLAQPNTKGKSTLYSKAVCGLAVGMDLRLSQPSDGFVGTLLGTRNEKGTIVQFSYNYFPTKHWGGFISAGLSFYKAARVEQLKSPNWPWVAYITPLPLFDEMSTAFRNTKLIHPELTIGPVYRYETMRWRLYPRLGIGWTQYLNNSEQTQLVGEDLTTNPPTASGKISYSVKSGNVYYGEIGVRLHYMIKPAFGVFADIGYRMPLNKMEVNFLREIEGEEPIVVAYKKRSDLRTMPILLGISTHF